MLDNPSGADPPTVERDEPCRRCGIDHDAADLNASGMCRGCVERATHAADARRLAISGHVQWHHRQQRRELRTMIDAEYRKWALYKRSCAHDAQRRADGLEPIHPNRRRKAKQQRHLHAPQTPKASKLERPTEALVESNGAELQRAFVETIRSIETAANNETLDHRPTGEIT